MTKVRLVIFLNEASLKARCNCVGQALPRKMWVNWFGADGDGAGGWSFSHSLLFGYAMLLSSPVNEERHCLLISMRWSLS